MGNCFTYTKLKGEVKRDEYIFKLYEKIKFCTEDILQIKCYYHDNDYKLIELHPGFFRGLRKFKPISLSVDENNNVHLYVAHKSSVPDMITLRLKANSKKLVNVFWDKYTNTVKKCTGILEDIYYNKGRQIDDIYIIRLKVDDGMDAKLVELRYRKDLKYNLLQSGNKVHIQYIYIRGCELVTKIQISKKTKT